MKAALEKDIQRDCLKWLSLMKVFAWRNNTAAIVINDAGGRRFLRAGIKGSSDIIGVVNGRMIAVEVKRPGKHPTEEQAAFLDAVIQAGGYGCCVHSVQELSDAITPLLKRTTQATGEGA